MLPPAGQCGALAIADGLRPFLRTHPPKGGGSSGPAGAGSGHPAEKEVEGQLSGLSTAGVAREIWLRNGGILLVDSMEEAVAASDEWVPEHLEVHAASTLDLLGKLRNYGSAFLGEEAAGSGPGPLSRP